MNLFPEFNFVKLKVAQLPIIKKTLQRQSAKFSLAKIKLKKEKTLSDIVKFLYSC
jgi:hypothetical protein